MELVPGQDTRCYRGAGGINNNAGAGVTGNVNIPVGDLVANPVSGDLTLYFTKKFD
jgi:hypothetical protein